MHSIHESVHASDTLTPIASVLNASNSGIRPSYVADGGKMLFVLVYCETSQERTMVEHRLRGLFGNHIDLVPGLIVHLV